MSSLIDEKIKDPNEQQEETIDEFLKFDPNPINNERDENDIFNKDNIRKFVKREIGENKSILEKSLKLDNKLNLIDGINKMNSKFVMSLDNEIPKKKLFGSSQIIPKHDLEEEKKERSSSHVKNETVVTDDGNKSRSYSSVNRSSNNLPTSQKKATVSKFKK